MQGLWIVIGVLLVLGIAAWAGLKVKPRAFAPFLRPPGPVEQAPLPAGLPAPVERFYRQLYGDSIPVIRSAVLSGRAVLRFGPLAMPGRFRFTHQAGKSYRHYIEVTFFGLPIMKVNERYVDGASRFQLPFLPVAENQPKTNQAANLGLWAESMWLPSVYLADPRARWEPIDEVTASLVVPFEAGEEKFIVRFDPASGMIRFLEAMRWRAESDVRKILWIDENLQWGVLGGWKSLLTGSVTWFDQGRPWAIFTVEDLVFNVDVGSYLLAFGE